MGEPGQPEEEPALTIRVSGMPADLSEADFNCWFLFAPGFEQATLAPSKGPGMPRAGWARFSTPEDAQAALQHLNGRQLTADQCPAGASLQAELARRNFRPRNPARLQAAEEAGGAAPALPGAGGASWSGAGAGAGGARAAAACCTLFAYRLLAESDEEELRQLCQEQCAGFERLKFVAPAGGKAGMCFLKFATHEEAAAALELLRGYAVSSSPTEALKVDFGKAELDAPKRAAPEGAGADLAAALAALPPQPPEPPLHSWGQQPCDTMFVGNLAASVTEEELGSALATLAGYERMKLVGQGGGRAMAFALFDSAQACARAIEALHGNALPSAPTQALTCEFSKNSLGKAVRC